MNFMSPVKAVDRIWIEKLPSCKPVKVQRVVKAGRFVVMQTENGRLFSDQAEQVCYVPGSFDSHADWFRALKALGVLTPAQVQAHKEACDRRDLWRSKQWAADKLASSAKELGFKLTSEQEALVKEFGSKKVRS